MTFFNIEQKKPAQKMVLCKPRSSRIGFFNAIFSRKKVFCFLFQAPKAGRPHFQHMGLFKGWIAMEKLIEIQETELE